MQLLQSCPDQSSGGHAHFEADLLPQGRVVELPRATATAPLDPPATPNNGVTNGTNKKEEGPSAAFLQSATWHPLAHFPHAIDFFHDGSLYLVDAPGHLQGHTNVLARTAPRKWVYLAGDACHDRRILTGEVGIATWKGARGEVCCIHGDVGETEKTLERIRGLGRVGEEVEVVLAHDVDWAGDRGNEARFWPGVL